MATEDRITKREHTVVNMANGNSGRQGPGKPDAERLSGHPRSSRCIPRHTGEASNLQDFNIRSEVSADVVDGEGEEHWGDLAHGLEAPIRARPPYPDLPRAKAVDGMEWRQPVQANHLHPERPTATKGPERVLDNIFAKYRPVDGGSQVDGVEKRPATISGLDHNNSGQV